LVSAGEELLYARHRSQPAALGIIMAASPEPGAIEWSISTAERRHGGGLNLAAGATARMVPPVSRTGMLPRPAAHEVGNSSTTLWPLKTMA
jgi:hypothetical protein